MLSLALALTLFLALAILFDFLLIGRISASYVFRLLFSCVSSCFHTLSTLIRHPSHPPYTTTLPDIPWTQLVARARLYIYYI